MSNDVDVMTGLAQLLDALGVATYNPTGHYGASDTAIVFKSMTADPDRVVCLTAYTYANMPDWAVDQIRVQIRCRGARTNNTDADVLAGAVYDQLHGRSNFDLGAVHVDQMLQQSSVPMGIDDSDRWERADNYTLDVSVPATLIRPA